MIKFVRIVCIGFILGANSGCGLLDPGLTHAEVLAIIRDSVPRENLPAVLEGVEERLIAKAEDRQRAIVAAAGTAGGLLGGETGKTVVGGVVIGLLTLLGAGQYNQGRKIARHEGHLDELYDKTKG